MRRNSYARNTEEDREPQSFPPRRRGDESVDEQDDGTQVAVRHRTGEEDEEEIAEDDARDHTMERLDEDDLLNMQGPDA